SRRRRGVSARSGAAPIAVRGRTLIPADSLAAG
ncbi:MAG: hypothetical protein ACI87W_002856, partial [Halieaceae bacterium]